MRTEKLSTSLALSAAALLKFGAARWEQGISENEYVKERGVWKISRVNY